MALFNRLEADRQSPTVYPVSTTAVEMPGPTTPVDVVGEQINPLLVTPEKFSGLYGDHAQAILLRLLEHAADVSNKSSAIDKINELRPDMKVRDPLSDDELEIAFVVGEIIERDQPITVPVYQNGKTADRTFDQIYALGYGHKNAQSKQELAELLERERQRAQVEFPGSLFAPAEAIGSYSAARRYLANLMFADNPDILKRTQARIEREREEIDIYNGHYILLGVID